jgi:hypothetical protein
MDWKCAPKRSFVDAQGFCSYESVGWVAAPVVPLNERCACALQTRSEVISNSLKAAVGTAGICDQCVTGQGSQVTSFAQRPISLIVIRIEVQTIPARVCQKPILPKWNGDKLAHSRGEL